MIDAILEYASEHADIYKLFMDNDRTLIIYSTLMGYEQIIKDLKKIAPNMTFINYMDYRGDPRRQIYGDGMEFYNQRPLENVKPNKAAQKPKQKQYVHRDDETHIHPSITLETAEHEHQYQQHVNYSKPRASHPKLRKVRTMTLIMMIIMMLVAALTILFYAVGLSGYESTPVHMGYAVVEDDIYDYHTISSEDVKQTYQVELKEIMYFGFNVEGELKDVSQQADTNPLYYYVSVFVNPTDPQIIYRQPKFVKIDERYAKDPYVYIDYTDEETFLVMSASQYQGRVTPTLMIFAITAIIAFILLIFFVIFTVIVRFSKE